MITISEGDAREVTGKADLVFADPPFNIGHKYEGFKDRISDDEYLLFTRRWIAENWMAVKPGGVLALHGSAELSGIYWEALFQLHMRKFYESQIIWYFGFGQCGFTNWINSHCVCIILRKPGDRKWNVKDVLVKSKRLKAIRKKTGEGDPRCKNSKFKGMVPPSTVWGIEENDSKYWGRVQGNNKERWNKKNGAPVDHPNQLPIRYVGRMVSAYTFPGDTVLDPFAGSGTSPLVCQALGRNCVATDISAANVKSALKRLEAHKELAFERLSR